MVRSHEDEINHRYRLRKKYLEDPSYRRWSDMAPDSGEINAFADWSDGFLFCCFITNRIDVGFTMSDLVNIPKIWIQTEPRPLRTGYQCFGPRLLTVYMPNLNRCYSRPDIWLFLKMAYPEAISKNDYLETLEEAVKAAPVKLWEQSYKFYDMVGHDKFGTIEYLIDNYREQIFQPTYDIIWKGYLL